MKARLFILIIMSLSWTAMSCCGTSDSAKAASDSVQIHISEKLAPVNDLFWGTNFLFWVEDDQALADGAIEKALSDLPCRMLRFPGGTVADNYHWKTNLLHNHNMFPYEEGDAESDFDEFMAFCTRVGAEPLLVVNTQSWALEGDIEGGAKEAAEWVRYCKEKGYRVRYWEIGNETYWHPVMTAKEYGALVNVYAKAMKAEDPDIVLSVNGGWDINMTGNKERTDPALWEEFRQGYLNASTVKEYKDLKERADSVTVKPWTTGEDKWWYDLITTCGDNVDMVSVHWYFFDGSIKHIEKKMAQLRALLKELKPHKNYPICLSEYNCNTHEPDLRVTGLAEAMGRFLNSGIEMSCFWPLRIGGRKTLQNDRSMLDLASCDAQYPWEIFHLFQKNLKGSMICCDSPQDIFTFASYDRRQLTVVLSGRCLKDSCDVKVKVPVRMKRWDKDVEIYEAGRDEVALSHRDSEVKISGKDICVTVRPGAFTVLTIRRR